MHMNLFWHAQKGTEVFSISGNHLINVVDYTSDGSLCIAGCRDRTIKIFDMSNLTLHREFKSYHNYQILSLHVNCTNEYFATGDLGGIVKFWMLEGQTVEKRIESHRGKDIKSIPQFSNVDPTNQYEDVSEPYSPIKNPNESPNITPRDLQVDVVNLNTFPSEPEFESPLIRREHTDAIKEETEEEKTDDEDEGTVKTSITDFGQSIDIMEYGMISDVLKRHQIMPISKNRYCEAEQLFMKFSDNDTLLVNGNVEFHIYSCTDGELLHKNKKHEAEIVGVCFTGPNDEYIWTADCENNLIVWDLTNNMEELTRIVLDRQIDEDKFLVSEIQHEKEQNIFKISNCINGQFVAVATYDEIKIYTYFGEEKVTYPNCHKDDIIMLEFHGDPKYCCSADRNMVKIANLNTLDWETTIINNHKND